MQNTPANNVHGPLVRDLTAFFVRLKEFQKASSFTHLRQFVSRWNVFRVGFASALKSARETEKRLAPAYNVFRVLDVQHDETATHSRFLAHLLNPKASHGQGPLFLKEFLDQLHRLGQQPVSSVAYSYDWYIDVERGIPDGRIDLVISCPRVRYLIAIENKVFATEQHGQLGRYHAWLETQSAFYSQRILVFLTPDGRLPRTANGCSCVPVSYRRDISVVLKRALNGITAPLLRSTLVQYIDVIEELDVVNGVEHEH